MKNFPFYSARDNVLDTHHMFEWKIMNHWTIQLFYFLSDFFSIKKVLEKSSVSNNKMMHQLLIPHALEHPWRKFHWYLMFYKSSQNHEIIDDFWFWMGRKTIIITQSASIFMQIISFLFRKQSRHEEVRRDKYLAFGIILCKFPITKCLLLPVFKLKRL